MNVSNHVPARASSIEHDILKDVLDQTAVGNIIDECHRLWDIDADAAWAIIQSQAALGRLRAYRGDGPFETVDLTQSSLAEVRGNYELWVEPTASTFERLNEIDAGRAS